MTVVAFVSLVVAWITLGASPLRGQTQWGRGHRDPEQPSDDGDERPLADDRQEHHDEDDSVDTPCTRDAANHGEHGEENRYCAFEATPRDEGALGPAETSRRERQRDNERTRNNREQEEEQHAVGPDTGAKGAQVDGEPESGEDDDLSEGRERVVEAL